MISISRSMRINIAYMKRPGLSVVAACLFLFLSGPACFGQADYTKWVNRFIGTGANGAVSPVAAVPFGMVQTVPNTYTNASGSHYDHKPILRFSQLNKMAGG